MNREIKFRIFANNKWYYKCLVGNTNNTTDDSWTCPLVWLDDKKDWVHCDNGIICQYTGLKDKNGVEIYEGDIVKHNKGNTYIVEFHNGGFKLLRFSIYKGKPVAYHDFEVRIMAELEVIGNIYKNKELLENE